MKRQNINRSDIRAMDSTGVMDRGAVDIKSRVSHNQGDIMAIASKDIVTLPPTTNIMGTAKTMLKYGFRRVPIADAGTNRLVGIITSLDIVDFLGGGLRHNIVKNRYKGNLAAAINEDVSFPLISSNKYSRGSLEIILFSALVHAFLNTQSEQKLQTYCFRSGSYFRF